MSAPRTKASATYSPINARSALLQAFFEGPGACADLIARLQTGSLGRVRFRQGPVSVALRSLERSGLVVGWDVKDAGRRGRPRRYYELTSRGIEVATSEREALRGLLSLGTPRVTPSARERRAMADRLRSVMALSDSARTLREAKRRPLADRTRDATGGAASAPQSAAGSEVSRSRAGSRT